MVLLSICFKSFSQVCALIGKTFNVMTGLRSSFFPTNQYMFTEKKRKSFLIDLPKRISIRLSILGIVLVLLVGISALIISINYIALNRVLIVAAKHTLHYAGERVSEQISSYFKPLNNDSLTALQLFNSGVITPEYSDKFIQFLYSLIINDENISAAYWGDISGNMYWINRVSHGNFLEQTIRPGDETIERVFNAQGKVLSTKRLSSSLIDPRTRPWYKKAQLKKQLVWVTYKFLKAGSEKEPLGVTAAFPFYDSRKKLLGVFAVDMLIESISKYLHDIMLTENSAIFVVDDTGDLISTYDVDKKFFEDQEMPKITSLDKQWLKKSFAIYQQTHQSPFVYKFNDNKYISVYEKIAGIKSDHPWFISIVMPIDDVISPLRKNVLIATLFTSMALIIGIILASIFSSALSRPIRKLAQDAHLICQLKLTEVKEIFSRIIEIAEMEDAFMKMKSALSSFQLYMPTALVKKLVVSNKVAAVGGETKELTLIFTDIQSFTSLSENIHPQQLMQYLSRYFQAITKVIIDMHGTVDKYIGDGLMAFWGAPVDDAEHALHACQAVLQTQKVLQKLNAEWRAENKPEVITRIGINTGNVVVGNVGSDDRLNYTSLGDHVNLASRLEGLNKIYGTCVTVSEFTYHKVKDKFKFRLLDKVAAKGKQHGIYVYELLEDMGAVPDLQLEQYNQEFFAAFSHYEKSDWQTATKLFTELEKKYPEDAVIKIFIKRCSMFSLNPPPNWHGVWVMTEK